MPPPSAPQQLHVATTVASAEFIPRGFWQLNEACGICGRGFIGVLRRRHHCRHCGMSVCGRHSRHREIVPSSLSPVRQRVCDDCRPACERGVTRPRRRTLGTRTISVRFDDDDGDSKETTTTSTTTESETLEAEPEPEEAVEEEASDGERAAEEHTRDSASSSDCDCDSVESVDNSEPETPPYLPAEQKKTATPPQPTTLLYEPTEPERRVMHEIAALELAIQKHQSELPALLERLQHTQRMATRLQAEAHESRLRVLQYQAAQRVVARAVRNARTLMREREFQAAILELLRAAGIDRASAAVYHLLAECRLQVAQLEDAECACRTSIRLRQQQASPVRDVRASVALLGRVLHAQGRLDEAAACFLTALGR